MKNNEPLIKEFLKYISNPRIEVVQSPPRKLILFNVVRLWAVVFLLSMFFAFFSNIFLSRSGYGEDDFALTQIVMDFPYLLILFLVVVWAPISEEIGFRLWLRFSPRNWAFGISFLSLFLFSFLNLPFLPDDYFTFGSWAGVFSSIALLLSVGVLVYRLLSYEKISFVVKKFFQRNFATFFYILAFSFALLHLTNYDVDYKTVWYFAPILIFPQLFLSFTISFVRMQYGFVWAVVMHGLNNVVAITPLLFLLPILEKIDGISFADMDLIESFSVGDMAVVLGIGSFLFLVLSLSFFSLVSLIYEMVKGNRVDI